MNILIENNSFTMDTRESRMTRLFKLKNNIENYASELSIMPEILDWALLASEEFDTLLNKQNEITNEKNNKFNIINENEKEFFQRLISFREIIISQISEKHLISFFKLNEQIPTTRIEKIEFATEFLNKIENSNEIVLNEMTSLVLHNLIKQLNLLRTSYGEALNLQEEGSNLTNRINKRFDQDSVNLRTLYNWCVIFWNKKDSKLIDLGFTIPKSTAKNPKTPEKIVGFNYLNKSFVWDIEKKSISYQLVHRNKFENVEWKIISETSLTNKNIDLSPGEYKVRGTNKFGFGPWSDDIIINEENQLI